MSFSSGWVRRSSALLMVQPRGLVWVQYWCLPSAGNCSIVASSKPSISSSFLTYSAASWYMVEAWIRWKRQIWATYDLAMLLERVSFTSLFSVMVKTRWCLFFVSFDSFMLLRFSAPFTFFLSLYEGSAITVLRTLFSAVLAYV